MERSVDIGKRLQIPTLGKVPRYVLIVISVYFLAVFQDYIYSRLQNTGFYLSESLLYNTFWTLFIPFTIFLNRIIRKINPNSEWYKLHYNVALGIVFSFLHLTLFAAIFVSISNWVFTPPHRFLAIFNTALSNQFYITVGWYVLFPIVYHQTHKPNKLSNQYPEKIKLKVGSKIIPVPASSIQLISTDKPYSVVYVNDQKVLDSKSLKEFETILDPTIFLRVHRSEIINTAFVKELKSRSNGDYDVRIENGQMIRLSRHYRKNWEQLLH